MIDLDRIEGIYLYQGITDMRRGINSLAALASTVMEKKDMLHRLFVFCGRDKRTLKILEMDVDGYWLYQKKCTTGKFTWPKPENGVVTIDKRQFSWLLDGLSQVQPKAHARQQCLTGNHELPSL